MPLPSSRTTAKIAPHQARGNENQTTQISLEIACEDRYPEIIEEGWEVNSRWNERASDQSINRSANPNVVHDD